MALRFSCKTAIQEDRKRKRLQPKERRIIRQIKEFKKRSKMNGFCLTQG